LSNEPKQLLLKYVSHNFGAAFTLRNCLLQRTLYQLCCLFLVWVNYKHVIFLCLVVTGSTDGIGKSIALQVSFNFGMAYSYLLCL